MRFVMHELHGVEALAVLPGFEAVSADLIDTVLEEAARFATGVLLPLNQSADAEGCHFAAGRVSTPSGFKEAYAQFVRDHWGTLNADPAYGGQGLPESLGKLVEEIICSCNVSFSLYIDLTRGAYAALRAHGSTPLQDIYLPKLATGEWSGTMCLTESHCGTDLGLLSTKATSQLDGSYRLSGSKIFISAGEHDLAENIIHLVLARIPGGPPGIKGVSLFLVPKFLPTAEGDVGIANALVCGGIEHKMGIRGAATCQINFDQATGFLVGEAHAGMRAMFIMMNSERLSVGIQGLGVAETAYQSAVRYARDRLQGRALSGGHIPGRAADPIIVHADVRRMMLTMRANNEGCRALGVWVANEIDRSERLAAGAEKQAAAEFVALMTPIVKALFTDLAFESANLALQCLGGHGYIVANGVEQFVRDTRIFMIYEGTNGIQALDLVVRKLAANDGAMMRQLLDPVRAFLETESRHATLADLLPAFSRAVGALEDSTRLIVERTRQDREEGAAAATDYLRMAGLVALGFMWMRSAKIARDRIGKATDADVLFYDSKIKTAAFYVGRLLPQVHSLSSSIGAGKSSVMAMSADAF